uniref:Uncharacterized protein n=1 Tax=Anguilla anguilla TaxID=7936 RepID=A0A0E9V3H9_ANGAN
MCEQVESNIRRPNSQVLHRQSCTILNVCRHVGGFQSKLTHISVL